MLSWEYCKPNVNTQSYCFYFVWWRQLIGVQRYGIPATNILAFKFRTQYRDSVTGWIFLKIKNIKLLLSAWSPKLFLHFVAAFLWKLIFLKSFLNPLQEAWFGFQIASYSVGDPEPDPHVFGPPGSISRRDGSGTGSFPFSMKVLSGLK